jgi:hypothetical protein
LIGNTVRHVGRLHTLPHVRSVTHVTSLHLQ